MVEIVIVIDDRVGAFARAGRATASVCRWFGCVLVAAVVVIVVMAFWLCIVVIIVVFIVKIIAGARSLRSIREISHQIRLRAPSFATFAFASAGPGVSFRDG